MGLVTDGNGDLVPGSLTSDTSLKNATNLAVNGDKQAALAQQLLLANKLRSGGDIAQGRMVGDIYAADPVGTAISTLNHLQGISDSLHGKKDSDKLISDRQNGLDAFMQQWGNRNKPQAPQADPTQQYNQTNTPIGLGMDSQSPLAGLLAQQ